MRKWIVALPVAAGLLTGVAETEVSVAGKPAHRIEKGVVGINQLAYGKDGCGFLLPGKKDVQPELVEMLKEIGIRSMRYPGGCGGTHMYDWKKSCGLNGWVEGLGLVQFLEVCEKTGAEPMLGLSAFRGSPGGGGFVRRRFADAFRQFQHPVRKTAAACARLSRADQPRARVSRRQVGADMSRRVEDGTRRLGLQLHGRGGAD